jgi:hypothetical protein
MNNNLYINKTNNNIYEVVGVALNFLQEAKDDEQCIVYKDVSDGKLFVRDEESFNQIMSKVSALNHNDIIDRIEKVILKMSPLQIENLFEKITGIEIIGNAFINDTKVSMIHEDI